MTTSAFDLPAHLSGKAAPALIAADERHFAVVRASLDRSIADASTRLDEVRKAPGRAGQEAMERDFEVHRLNARLRSLRRFGVDLCLGHLVRADDGQTVYIGRLGLLDDAGEPLLIDWRSPAAEPFFGATHADSMGITRRRRYRWINGRVSDYWDEVFVAAPGGPDRTAALDDRSAFVASLGSDRSDRMRDVLGTIASDQDAVIRAGSSGALVVDGGPGTGKTVVALHRAAYLLYSDPRMRQSRMGGSFRRLHSGVLFVGPHEPFLAYVEDVLPSLGEEGVQLCTLADLVTEGASAPPETDPEVARLKASAHLVTAVEAAVRFYEQPPTGDGDASAADWSEAFDAPEPGTPHNEAREQIWAVLQDILRDKGRETVQDNDSLREALDSSWTLIEAADLVADLWSVPAYLARCAPWLTPEERRILRRADPYRWTQSDLPLLDAARRRLGDPQAARLARRRERAAAAERLRMDRVVDELVAADDDEKMAAQLRQDGIRDALVDDAALPQQESNPLDGPFAHIIVDEAQELTDAQWQMLISRCPSRSMTIVGDRAQARRGFSESWRQRLGRIGLNHIDVASLSINYRTPSEIMAVAAPVIRAVLPDANVPMSIRSNGIEVGYGCVQDLDSILQTWRDEHADGTACVIGAPEVREIPRVRWMTPESAKGLEFDLVVLVDADAVQGGGTTAAVDRYVAMTRATQRLVVLTDR